VGIYSPNHQFNHWGMLLSMGTPDSPVRQPRHPTVRVLTQSTIGALTSGGTGQSGATPDRHCSLSGAPLTAALHCCPLFAHCSPEDQLLQSTVAQKSRCSAGAPDSPVNYSGAASKKPKAEEFRVVWPGAPDTVRCARPGNTSISFAPFFLNPNLIFYWFVLNLYAPVEYII
jgi:hypothetical protein